MGPSDTQTLAVVKELIPPVVIKDLSVMFVGMSGLHIRPLMSGPKPRNPERVKREGCVLVLCVFPFRGFGPLVLIYGLRCSIILNIFLFLLWAFALVY